MFGSVNLDEDMCKIIPLERAYVKRFVYYKFDFNSSFFYLAI